MPKSSKNSEVYSYRQVEDALAKALDIPPHPIAPLRARLKVFQRIGFTPEKPGRGKVIRYAITDIYDWALGLALADLGLDPKAIAAMIEPGSTMRLLQRIAADDDYFYMVQPHALKPDGFTHRGGLDGRGVTADTINRLAGGRVSLINIKMLLQAVDKALIGSEY